MRKIPEGPGSATPSDSEGPPAPPSGPGPLAAGPRRHPVAAAWAASSLLHILLLIVAAFITVGGGPGRGPHVDDAELIGIAVLTESELGQLSEAALEASTPVLEALDDPLAVQVDLRLPDTVAALDDPLSLADSIAALTAGLGAGDISSLALGGAGGSAAFFGVEASGGRIAYLVDISGSMDVGIGMSTITRLDVLKRELANSVAALPEGSQFFVVLFEGGSRPLGGRMEWAQASEAGKAWARRNIAQIQSAGGTEPIPGFKMIFALRPRPDVIYFMTDGEFDEDAPRQINVMNGDLRIPIHTICFDSTEGEHLMRKIAEDSGGSYTYVPGAAR
jgi:hypothetical protein